MKFILPMILLGVCAFGTHNFLPSDLNIYVPKKLVSLKPQEGFEQKQLPVMNHFKGEPGGYVAVYTHEANNSVFSITKDIYVAGLVRLAGRYHKNLFIPFEANRSTQYSKNPRILDIVAQYFPELKGKCWVNGDTIGWLGK